MTGPTPRTRFDREPVDKSSQVQPLKIPETIASEPAWKRLEDQIQWYDRKSAICQKWYKRLKFVQITLAGGIPLSSLLSSDLAKWIASAAGSLIALMEGVQHMNQYSTLWVTYRATAEALKHEKFLFLSSAGPYRSMEASSKFVVLAERIEERISTEHSNWNRPPQVPVPSEGKDVKQS